MYPDSLFYSTNSLKPKDIQFTVINDWRHVWETGTRVYFITAAWWMIEIINQLSKLLLLNLLQIALLINRLIVSALTADLCVSYMSVQKWKIQLLDIEISDLFVSHTESCHVFPPHSGHSHQLFHVSAVVGTHFQMEGVIADMTSRRAWLVAHGAMPSFLGTIGVLVVSLVLNLGIIGIFSAPLLWKPCHASNQPHASARECKEQWGRIFVLLFCLRWLLTVRSSACLTPLVVSFREDFDTSCSVLKHFF